MNNKERLEEIKNRYDWVELKPSHIVDVDWLINRVEELENNIKVTDFFNRLYKKRATELEISRKEIAETVKKEYLQNKRYKQALEEIARQHDTKEIDDDEFMYNAGRLAREALEESE